MALSAAARKRQEAAGRGGNQKRRRNRQTTKEDRGSAAPSTRPVITDYNDNRNRWVNRGRLSDSISCEHFGPCPGCAVDDKVANIETIRSAKLYFSSSVVRANRMDVQDTAVMNDDEEDFFQVVVPSDVIQWRTQAKLAVAPKSSSWSKDGCIFGLYKRRSHSVLSIPQCQVHHPSINVAIQALVKATAKVGTAAFNEQSREGGLRYVQCQVERTTGKICLTLIWNAEHIKETQPALSRLVKQLQKLQPGLWHSIWCHCNNAMGNAIFHRNSRRWQRLVGPEFLREPLPAGNVGWLYFTPLTFRQGNMDGFDILAMDVARMVPPNSRVCELYAGVGVLGLTALAHHYYQSNNAKPLVWLRCSDENPFNPRCFNRALNSLPAEMTGRDLNESQNHNQRNSIKKIPDEGITIAQLAELMQSGGSLPPQDDDDSRNRPKTSYMVASAGQAILSGQALGADVLIVDPPRKGLEEEVLAELCKPFNPNQACVESPNLLTTPDEKVNWANDVSTLIYVSCGFDALARDCDELLSSKSAGWKLASATGYILFPGSDHVETVCVFRR